MPEKRSDVPTVSAGGARIPRLGLGTWQLSGQQCTQIVETALELGYRHIDTAQKYDNETAVGEGLAGADVDRAAVFLTTKVTMQNALHGDVVASVQASLDRLDVAYVDLLLVHAPHPKMSIETVLDSMATVRDDGLVRHLGVSNFSRALLHIAQERSDVQIVTDQVQFHPFWAQSSLLDVCAEHDVSLTAYSPLDRGRLLQNETLAAIGDRHEKTPAQVALRWLLQHEGVVVIPKTTDRAHLEENRAVFDFELSAAEMRRIDALSPGPRRRLQHAFRTLLLGIVSGGWRVT
jgi:2,5-diketo-D-gluconate reductase B